VNAGGGVTPAHRIGCGGRIHNVRLTTSARSVLGQQQVRQLGNGTLTNARRPFAVKNLTG